MNQLNCLPQENIFWGADILQTAVSHFEDYGIVHPITFTIAPLASLNETLLQPHIRESVGTFLDLPAHVPDFTVQQGLAECLRLEAGSIIALGGGSVLDAAKAVSYLHFQKTGRYLPIAALPTTLSGSEFSHYFGITETDGVEKFKRSYGIRETAPKVVVIDPTLLLDTPRALLLSSAIKGMDHAVEGMRKVGVEHPHAIMSASGVKRFFEILEKWPSQLETRPAIEKGLICTEDLLQLQLAAWQCYFSPASVIYGLSHRIGHILGGTYGLPHSVTSCITLAPVIRASSAYYGTKLEAFSRRCASSSAADHLALRISNLVTHLELPNCISQFGIDQSELRQISHLLKSNYPNEVQDLGHDAYSRLDQLLERLW